MDGAVFAVNRQHLQGPLARGLHDKLAGHDQRLLIRQAQLLSGADSLIGCHQPRSPVGSGNDEIHFGEGRSLHLPADFGHDLEGSAVLAQAEPFPEGLD